VLGGRAAGEEFHFFFVKLNRPSGERKRVKKKKREKEEALLFRSLSSISNSSRSLSFLSACHFEEDRSR
jgi:hypothetical protein